MDIGVCPVFVCLGGYLLSILDAAFKNVGKLYFFKDCLLLYLFLWFCIISYICIVQILSVVCWNMSVCNTNTWETDIGSLHVQGQPAFHSKTMEEGTGIGKAWENRYYLLSFIVS